MADKLVTVEIDENGDTSVDLTGFHGKGCAAVAAAFDELGKVTTSRTKTEFNEGPGQNSCITSGR